MKLTRAEQARLIEIDKWLADEEMAFEKANRTAGPVVRRILAKTSLGADALDKAMEHFDLPLAHLKWLLALVKREAAGR